MTIGERIREIRKAESLTLEEFGNKIGIKKGSLSQLENSVTNPSDQTIRSICREFGVSEDWLRTGAGAMRPPPDREKEMAALINALMADRPESFRSALITALLRFSPDGPEWKVLEAIYENVAKEMGRDQ